MNKSGKLRAVETRITRLFGIPQSRRFEHLRSFSKTVFALVTACFLIAPAIAATPQSIHLEWDPATLKLIQPGGNYARMARTTDAILCCFEIRGKSWVRRSVDEGVTWQDPALAAAYDSGSAANPELLCCRDGRVLLFDNQRPRDKQHAFSIAMSQSNDGGRTWQPRPQPIFSAGDDWGHGCYEPAAIELPSGEIQLYFANELPHESDQTQEISLTVSSDHGQHWSKPRAVCYRAGHRDGMPVPIILANHRGLAFAVEDNGVTADHQFKPTIIHSPNPFSWGEAAIGAGDALRWPAVDRDWPANIYAGAPYLRQLSSGETILSCQCDEDRPAPRMRVYLGDADAKHFGKPTEPFGSFGQHREMWNALFVKNAATVTAISSTRINDQGGVWAIDGRVIRD